jgi:hypothetical protein
MLEAKKELKTNLPLGTFSRRRMPNSARLPWHVTTTSSNKEQSGGCEDAAVDGPEGGASDKEGHDP